MAEGELVKLRIGETSWTDEQTQTLTRLWNSGLSATLIAPQIGVTRSAALGKLKRLGLLGNRRLLRPRKPRERSVWTDETARKLRRLWEEGESTSDIAFALGVSPGAIRYKSSSLGLANSIEISDRHWLFALPFSQMLGSQGAPILGVGVGARLALGFGYDFVDLLHRLISPRG